MPAPRLRRACGLRVAPTVALEASGFVEGLRPEFGMVPETFDGESFLDHPAAGLLSREVHDERRPLLACGLRARPVDPGHSCDLVALYVLVVLKNLLDQRSILYVPFAPMGDRDREGYSRHLDGVILAEDAYVAYLSHVYRMLFRFCVSEHYPDVAAAERTNPHRTGYLLLKLSKNLLRLFVLVFIV